MIKKSDTKFFLYGILLIACVAQIALSGVALASPLQIRDLLSLTRFSLGMDRAGAYSWADVAISPDGTRVAYVISTGDDSAAGTVQSERRQVWVLNIVGGSPHRIEAPKAADNCQPAWSPDGTWLAFYSTFHNRSQIAVWNAKTGSVRVLKVLVDATGFVPRPLQWTSDSTRVLAARIVGESTGTAYASATPTVSPTPAIMVFTSNPTKSNMLGENVVRRVVPDHHHAVDLTLVDVRTGMTTATLAKGVVPVFYQLSPDETKLLYVTYTGVVSGDPNNRNIYDVYVNDVSTGLSTRVAQDILSLSPTLSWSHDGSKLAFIGGNLKNDAGVPIGYAGTVLPGSVYIIDVHHPGTLRQVSRREFARGSEPRWSDNDTTIYAYTWDYKSIEAIALATGKSRPLLQLHNVELASHLIDAGHYLDVVAIAEDGRRQIYSIDLHSGRSRIVFEGFASIGGLTFSRNGARCAYAQGDIAHPGDVWSADSDFAKTRELTHLNPQIDERSLSDMQETVKWHSRLGVFRGTLLLPVGYQLGKRYPMILWVYPGENDGTEMRTAFGMAGNQRVGSYFNMQLFASRGYAVFVPNSTLRVGHPMRDIADVILPGVDKVVAMGVADPARLGVYGQSYGGYATLSLIVQTGRFRAAVATSGIVDLISNYATMQPDGSDWTGWAESEQGRMGGTPWQYRDRYIENSPFFYLNRVHTPVLLEYGSDDFIGNVNMPEAFVALRRLGKTAMLVRYTGENHVLSETSNQIDFSDRMIAWFQKYLNRQEKPAFGRKAAG